MNGIVAAGNRATSSERTALNRTTKQQTPGGALVSQGQGQAGGGGDTVHHVQQTVVKHPEPLCILGCCGRGKLVILWSVSCLTNLDAINLAASSRDILQPSDGSAATYYTITFRLISRLLINTDFTVVGYTVYYRKSFDGALWKL